MMRRENGRVVIDIDELEYNTLMMALSYAAGTAAQKSQPWSTPIIKLVNSINEGNPNFTPYQADQPRKPMRTTKRGTDGFGSTGY